MAQAQPEQRRREQTGQQQRSSVLTSLAVLPTAAARRQAIRRLTGEQAAQLAYDWRGVWARPCYRRPDGTYGGQLPPDGDWWSTWLVMSGRGYGKTRLGAEWVIEQAQTGVARRIALVARSSADAVLTM